MECIYITLNIENNEMECDITNKKCNFEHCQKLCLDFDDASEYDD